MPAQLGSQLTRKVKRGEISRGRARKTVQERQTFKAAYGADWRTKVYGQGGAKAASGPFASRDVAAKRSQALSVAKGKLGGGVQSAKRLAPKKGHIEPIPMAPMRKGEGKRKYLSGGRG